MQKMLSNNLYEGNQPSPGAIAYAQSLGDTSILRFRRKRKRDLNQILRKCFQTTCNEGNQPSLGAIAYAQSLGDTSVLRFRSKRKRDLNQILCLIRSTCLIVWKELVLNEVIQNMILKVLQWCFRGIEKLNS